MSGLDFGHEYSCQWQPVVGLLQWALALPLLHRRQRQLHEPICGDVTEFSSWNATASLSASPVSVSIGLFIRTAVIKTSVPSRAFPRGVGLALDKQAESGHRPVRA